MISVCCFLWRDDARQRSYTFDERHVITLRNMVARHLKLPHEFVCVTEREFIADVIRCVLLDDRSHVPGTCGRKLTVWAPDAATRIGKRILALDLDMVIVDDITPLIDRPEPNVMFRNPNYTDGGRRAFYQGSIQLLNAGSQPHVWSASSVAMRQPSSTSASVASSKLGCRKCCLGTCLSGQIRMASTERAVSVIGQPRMWWMTCRKVLGL